MFKKISLIILLASLNLDAGEVIMQVTEFSLILKSSSLGGIGVFAVHDISAGSLIFKGDHELRKFKIKDIPSEFIKFCIYINDEECLCPQRFDRLEIICFLNHSDKPNIATNNSNYINDVKDRRIYATCTIKAGDEILIDYNCLGEPEHLKDDFYK